MFRNTYPPIVSSAVLNLGKKGLVELTFLSLPLSSTGVSGCHRGWRSITICSFMNFDLSKGTIPTVKLVHEISDMWRVGTSRP